MEILYFFENLRTPLLDKFFLAITQLGDETFFIAAALIVFWCVSKKSGYYMMTVCFCGTIINQFLKLICRIPRPWVIDPDFTIVEAAKNRATGYSFPSGHAQNAVSIFGCIAASVIGKKGIGKYQKNAICIFCAAAATLTAISRMYLGVHTLYDISVSAVIAILLVLAFKKLFDFADKNEIVFKIIIAQMLVMSVGYLIYASFVPISGISQSDISNFLNGKTHAWYLLGGVAGIAVSYPLEKRFVNFKTKAPLFIQIIKTVPGFLLTILIKTALKVPLLSLFDGNNAAHALRYFILVIFAVLLWPMTFELFLRLKRK